MSGSATNGAYVYWVSMAAGEIPNNAVLGGADPITGKQFYIGRTKVRGHVIPGMVVPADRCVYLTWRGKTIVRKTYEILVAKWNTQGLHWIPRTDGQTASCAVQGGQTKLGEPLYIARVYLPKGGGIWAGPFNPKDGGCRLLHKGKEDTFGTYELLCHRSKSQDGFYMYQPARDSPTIRDIIRALKTDTDKSTPKPTWLIC